MPSRSPPASPRCSWRRRSRARGSRSPSTPTPGTTASSPASSGRRRSPTSGRGGRGRDGHDASSAAVASDLKVGSKAWIERYGLSAVETCRLAQLELARQDKRFFSLEADLGDFGGFPFRDEFPDRYIDFGIAEASLVGAAGGLALRGKIPLINTFASFALMRACEQVRLDLCYHKANAKIFGTFAGLQAGFSGPTHHSIEDIAIARAFPGMTVIAPADAVAAYWATLAAGHHPGPVYIRLAVDVTAQVYGEDCRFEIGKGNMLRDGGDLTLVASGLTVVAEALAAADLLARDGIDARVIDLHTIKPIDRELLARAARETGLLLTVEEHTVYGGLGGAVAEVVAEEAPVPMRILGIPDAYAEYVGPYTEHLRRYGIDAAGHRRRGPPGASVQEGTVTDGDRPPLGILMLEGKMADVPGCMACEATFPYPVVRKVVRGSKHAALRRGGLGHAPALRRGGA